MENRLTAATRIATRYGCPVPNGINDVILIYEYTRSIKAANGFIHMSYVFVSVASNSNSIQYRCIAAPTVVAVETKMTVVPRQRQFPPPPL